MGYIFYVNFNCGQWAGFQGMRSVLVELAVDEGFEFGERLVGVVALGVDGDSAAGVGGQHHQAHDALAVDLFAVLFHEDVAAKAVGGFDEHGRRPGVDARLVGDGEFLGEELAGVSCFLALIGWSGQSLVARTAFSSNPHLW